MAACARRRADRCAALHRLHCGRHLNGSRRSLQPVGAGFANEVGGLDQRAHALLEKQRIALGALDEKPLERRDAGIVADQRAQKFLGAGDRQRIDAQPLQQVLPPQLRRYSGR